MTDETGSGSGPAAAAAEVTATEVPAPEVLSQETLENVTPSNLTKVLLFFVGGAVCGILIGLTVATLTRETPPDFVSSPVSGAFITGDELLDVLHPEETEET